MGGYKGGGAGGADAWIKKAGEEKRCLGSKTGKSEGEENH